MSNNPYHRRHNHLMYNLKVEREDSNKNSHFVIKSMILAVFLLLTFTFGFGHTQKSDHMKSIWKNKLADPDLLLTSEGPNNCVVNTQKTPKTLKTVDGNFCIPGQNMEECKTWRMTNGIILKYEEDVTKNCDAVLEYTNMTTSTCTSSSQIQWLFPDSGTSDCTLYNFNSPPLKRAMSNFNFTKTLITSKNQSPGQSMFLLLQNVVNCMQKPSLSVSVTDGAILNIFTDMTYTDLCSNELFVSTFTDTATKLINGGYMIKFIFMNQYLADTRSNIEAVLPGCKYNDDSSACEILDSVLMQNTDSYQICLASQTINNKFNNGTLKLVLIIGIPSLCLTICCITFFACCLKCMKLKLAFHRLQMFNNQEDGKPENPFRRGYRKPKSIEKIEGGKDDDWAHFSATNNYMDINALATANKKDVWEIESSNLLVQEDHLLGNGAFANVYKGILKGKIPLLVVNNKLNVVVESENDGHFEAAVKKLPPHADEQNRLDFFHEIEFMKRLGHHPHVISMLGCVSNIYDPMIVVEYCSRGDMLKFLRRHKDYVLMSKEDDCPVEADMCVRIKDLVSFSWQIADGMAYVNSKNFIHRDLAARNVLLTKSFTAKVSDFGLCRYMDSALYTAKGGRLPIKWMSTEALKFYEFSSKSDVWSFGVVLYEIFSLGDVPYPTVQQIDMLEYLLSGKRLPQPIKCPNEIYSIMKRCWAEKPEDRPEFNEIRGELAVMLNLDDESYGYLSMDSDDGYPRTTALTMQDSFNTAQQNDTNVEVIDEEEANDRCKKLGEVMSERFGPEQASEIQQIICEVFPKPPSVSRNSTKTSTNSSFSK